MSPPSVRWQTHRCPLGGAKCSISPKVVIEAENNDTMFDICACGQCSGFIMRELVYKHILNGTFPPELLCFPVSDLNILHSCGIAYPKGFVPEHISAFVECCKDVLKESERIVKDYIKSQFD